MPVPGRTLYLPDLAALEASCLQSDVCLSALPPLRREVKVLATRAETSKAFTDLYNLMNCFRQDPTLAQYQWLQDIFFRLLRAPTPSACRDPMQQRAANLATVALQGILEICTYLGSTLHSDTSRLSVTFLRSWPDFWKWILFLYSQTSMSLGRYSTTPLNESDQRIMIVTARIISRFFAWPSTTVCKTIQATPGTFSVIANLWMKQSERIDDDERANDCAGITGVLAAYLQSDLDRYSKEITEIAGGEKKIASRILAIMRIACQGGQPWMVPFPVLTSVCTILANCIPGAYSHLLSRNIVGEICEALKFFASDKSHHSVTPTQRCLCTFPVIDFFIEAVAATDGFKWIIEAIHADLLTSILRCTRWSIESMNNQGARALRVILPYLVYRSVLRAVGRALQDPVLCETEAQIPLEDKEFWTTWAFFRRTVKIQLEIKADFDEAGKFSQPCSSPECFAVETTESFRLCSACHEACYCSRTCQKSHWKSGKHRVECDRLRKDRLDGKASPISPRDHAFFVHLSGEMMDRHYDDIIKMRDMHLSDEPSARLAFMILFDHADFPSTIGVCTSDAFLKGLNEMTPRYLKSTVDKPSINPVGETPITRGSTIVYLSIKVPYGSERLVVPMRPERASEMFGWNNTQPNRQSGVEVVNQFIECPLTSEEEKELAQLRELDRLVLSWSHCL
ncbi:hypothetical protein BDZ94DRAFT_742887 [Collybia nuda]|uniref:MYND-type domain-containing protein n=1 Tax=Collybia nuda TaxID=64659 RepID=A0A9P5Y4T8_9AGAR|nr:hypothetical protein BDZ94DRAFT_742887 [Collybia nuda]